MFLLHSARSSIDPSFFRKSLKDTFIKAGRSSFDLHAQLDVDEVSEILLEELTGPSVVTSAADNIKSFTSIICCTCHQLNRTEPILPILSLPVLRDCPTSLAKVLETESLIGSNATYCHICSSIREIDCKLSLSNVGNCLIVQLNRFSVSTCSVTNNSAPFFVSSSRGSGILYKKI